MAARPRPYFIPVPPAPALSSVEANEIADAAGIPADSSKYRPLLISHILDVSRNEPADKRRYFKILLELAKNPCSKESVTGTLNNLTKNITEKTEEGADQMDINAMINSVIYGLAVLLVSGFDETDKANLVFDKNGNVIDVRDAVRSRMPLCDAYLKSKKWRATPGVDYGGKKRKTKKKTLRRRKFNRKMHTRHLLKK